MKKGIDFCVFLFYTDFVRVERKQQKGEKMKEIEKEVLRIAIEGNNTEYVNKYTANLWSEITSSDVDSLINNFDKLSHNQSIALRTLAASALKTGFKEAEKYGNDKLSEVLAKTEATIRYLEQNVKIFGKEQAE